MIKILSLEETIKKGAGRYYRNDVNQIEGGVAPAPTNLPHHRYFYNGEVYNLLYTDTSSGVGGFAVGWRVEKAEG